MMKVEVKIEEEEDDININALHLYRHRLVTTSTTRAIHDAVAMISLTSILEHCPIAPFHCLILH